MNLVLAGVIAYVLLQLAIGVAVSRRVASEEDYLLAGRSLGYGLATFTFFATWFGAESCINATSEIYTHGLSGGSADPFGYGLCIVFLGLVFAVPLWKRGLTTVADLFRQRYSPGVERLAVLILVPTSIFWAAAQIRAFGQVLSATSGAGVTLAITIAAVVAVVYTVFGGLRADVITDAVQGVVIIIGLVVLLFAVVGALGGFHAAWASVEPERLRLFRGADGNIWDTLEAWAVPVCGSVVAQELIARVAAAKSPQVAQRSAMMGGGLYLTVGLIPAFIGLVAVKLLPDVGEAEQVLPLLAQEHLSTFLYIVFAGALVSAILSTVDSSLLAAASLVSHNLVVPLKPGITESAKVRLARIGVIVGGLTAYGLALSAENIYSLVEASSSFGGAGLFTIMVFGLFTRLGGRRSAFAALAASVAVWGWGTWVRELEHPFLWSMAAAFGAYGLFAMTLARPRKSQTEA